MRTLVLGLILVNVLYWTWAKNIDTTPVKITQALDPDLPRLELIAREEPVLSAADLDAPDNESADKVVEIPLVGSDAVVSVDDPSPLESVASVEDAQEAEEVPPEPSPAAQIPVISQTSNLLATVDPIANPARCVGVGPFVSLRQASDAAALLNEAGLTTSQRVEESQVWVGHWVHLPSYPTRAAAVEVVEELRKVGIKDIYIEPSGELKNTISLGLFTERERAEVRAGKVRRLGDVKPQIRNRSRDGLVYWIDAPVDAGISIDTETLPHNSSQELRVESVDCPPLSAQG